MLRTPISKQRNKHIQHVLVEAAKLAPRQCHELALIYEKEMQRGNRNRATLAVARGGYSGGTLRSSAIVNSPRCPSEEKINKLGRQCTGNQTDCYPCTRY